MTSSETSVFNRSARASSRVRCMNMNRVFGSAVSGSVSESSCVCSKTIEL